MMHLYTAGSQAIATPHRLSMLPAAVLAQMVVRQRAALEGLLRGGSDGSTSGDRMLSAVTTLEDAKRLEQVANDWANYGGRRVGEVGSSPTPQFIDYPDAEPISPRVAAACLIAVIGIISAHWAWSVTL